LLRPYRPFRLAITLVLVSFTCAGAAAQEPATSGTFVLHKFARAIGNETYTIETKAGSYTLTSHFLFTDRGSKVPLETTFIASTAGMSPRSYVAKGQVSRGSEIDDALTMDGDQLSIAQRQNGSAKGGRAVVYHGRLLASRNAGTNDALVARAWQAGGVYGVSIKFEGTH